MRQYLIELFSEYDEENRNKTIDKLTSLLIREENYDEAISIFLHWNRYEDGIRVIEKYAQNIINTKLLNEFPIEYYNRSIDLAFIAIFFNYLNLDYERCSLICNSLKDDTENDILKSIKVFKLVLENSFVDDRYFDLLTEIDNNLNSLTKTIYYIVAAWAFGFWGQCEKALEMQELIKKTNKELNNSYVDLVYEYSKVSILEEMGMLNKSVAGYRELEERISSKNYKSCFTIFRTVGLPGVYIKKLMDREAEELLKEAEIMIKDFMGRAVSNSINYGVMYNLAEVKYIQGKIDECESLFNNLNINDKEDYVCIQILGLKIRLLSTEGRIKKEEINKFINLYEKIYKDSKSLGEIQITYGLSLFEIGKYEDSLNVFNNIVFMCRKNKIGYFLVYSLLWKLIVLNKIRTDSTRECLNILKEAIFYSREEDILFPYYKNRKYLKEIIQKFKKELLEDKYNEKFIRRLDDIFGVKDENEVLSSRELEVLQTLIDGLSNKEIGETLFISVSTVKTHIINIYSKLGVKNRVEAVNKGRKIININ